MRITFQNSEKIHGKSPCGDNEICRGIAGKYSQKMHGKKQWKMNAKYRPVQMLSSRGPGWTEWPKKQDAYMGRKGETQ